MNLIELGQTGVKVPEIGIGTYRYKGSSELLRQGVELGARFIDTAELYGNESIVGQAIKGLRDQVFIATKANHWRYHDVLQAADASLKRLGVDCIDLYQLHWPNAAVPIAETMAAMAELVEQGKVRFIGVSNFSVGEMQKAQAALGEYHIVANQVRYSLVERTIEPELLPYCQRMQITVIAYSPLAQGLAKILEADPNDVLGEIARTTQKTRAQVALNWCLAKSGGVVIPKTESLRHMTENCQSTGWRLTADQIAMLDRGVRFRRRSRLEAALRRCVRGMLQRLGRMDGK